MNARKQIVILTALAVPLFLGPTLAGQTQGGMGNMQDMHGKSEMGEMQRESQQNPQAAADATESMSHEHMEMNAHMVMTSLRPANAADQQRGDEILETLRQSVAKYKDYRAALADGYQIFAPKLPTKRKHFTNWGYGYEAQFGFDPAHPTSLLYDRTPDGGWQLVGAMYTAPRSFTEDQLNQRIPLSVARWHRHVNFCFPPEGQGGKPADWKKFGMGGSISTEEACQQAGGRWVPQIFGWMVHVYPFEQDPEKIWAH